jgi:hypothetical protein
MAFSNTALNAATQALTDAATWISAHTGDPGTTGASEVAGGSYAREQTTWGAESGGDSTGSQVAITIPASTTVSHFGIWTTETTGTFYGGAALTGGSEAFTSAGVLNLTPTIDADSA